MGVVYSLNYCVVEKLILKIDISVFCYTNEISSGLHLIDYLIKFIMNERKGESIKFCFFVCLFHALYCLKKLLRVPRTGHNFLLFSKLVN